MGGSASKAARSATGAASRKYPSRVSNPTSAPPPPPPPFQSAAQTPSQAVGPQTPKAQQSNASSIPPELQPSSTRTEAINADASDPTFAAHLRRLGPVTPLQNFSPSSTSPFDSSLGPDGVSAPPPPAAFPSPRDNPALALLAARQRLQEEADEELARRGRKGFEGRRFLAVGEVRRAVGMWERGVEGKEIERELGLREGLADRLGARGTVGILGSGSGGS